MNGSHLEHALIANQPKRAEHSRPPINGCCVRTHINHSSYGANCTKEPFRARRRRSSMWWDQFPWPKEGLSHRRTYWIYCVGGGSLSNLLAFTYLLSPRHRTTRACQIGHLGHRVWRIGSYSWRRKKRNDLACFTENRGLLNESGSRLCFCISFCFISVQGFLLWQINDTIWGSLLFIYCCLRLRAARNAVYFAPLVTVIIS